MISILKILIVDDEYIMRQGLRYMIPWEKEGYKIIGEATNGKEALELTETLHPHIIICDVVMPLVDGIDFVEIVHKIHPEIQLIILSGYDKFEYVKQTLINGASDYILKPVLNPQVLRQVLQNASDRLPHDVKPEKTETVNYNHMIERYLVGHDQTLNIAPFADFFTNEIFHLYAVDIKKESDTGKGLYEILYKKIEREVAEIHDVQTLIVLLREEIACIILCHARDQSARILRITKCISDKLSFISDHILGIYSRPFHTLTQINTIYHSDILPYIGLQFYYPDTNLLSIESLKPSDIGKPLKFNFLKYSHYMENKQFADAIQLLRQYNEDALSAKIEEHRLKNQIKNVVYYFLDLLPLSDEEHENYRYDFFYKIDHACTEADYKTQIAYITDCLLNLCGDVLPKDTRIEQIVRYINENYKEELKLEDLAFRFNFNYSYLSAYFNSQVHENFSDYLNRVRIDKACELLQAHTLTISQISHEVGYSEHSYFCRVFRKITGKTPSAWRRNSYEMGNQTLLE